MGTGASGDFGDLGDLDGFGEVFEAGADLEFGGGVDVVEVFEAVVESEESPASCWALCWLAVVRGCRRDGIDEPSALEEAVDALLAHELEGLFVQFFAEITNGQLAKKIIVHLKFLHLPLPNSLVPLLEVLFHFVPLSRVFAPQSDFQLATNKGDDARKVTRGRQALVPHPDEEFSGEVVDFVEVE